MVHQGFVVVFFKGGKVTALINSPRALLGEIGGERGETVKGYSKMNIQLKWISFRWT